MKKTIIIATLACYSICSQAQKATGEVFTFTYDDSGNRIGRTYFNPYPASTPAFEIVEMNTEMDITEGEMEEMDGTGENEQQEEMENALLAAGKILVYPNPNGGVFNICLPLQNGASAQITLYDYAGRQVYQTRTETSQNIVDISLWPNGTYIVKIALAGQVVLWRVVKR